MVRFMVTNQKKLTPQTNTARTLLGKLVRFGARWFGWGSACALHQGIPPLFLLSNLETWISPFHRKDTAGLSGADHYIEAGLSRCGLSLDRPDLPFTLPIASYGCRTRAALVPAQQGNYTQDKSVRHHPGSLVQYKC